LNALRSQGFLIADERFGGAVTYWKLRFRFRGRLRSVYVGSDAAKVERVRAELREWQESRVTRRERARLEQYARETLRQAKARLQPELAKLGYYYHGDTVRKRRRSTVAAQL
jgi:hypothetical protein